MGTEIARFDPLEQLKKETQITERDFYEVYDPRQGKRKVPNARVYNIWAKEASIKTRILNAGRDTEKAWAHVKGWIGKEDNPVAQREAKVTIFWKTELEDLVWNAITDRKDKYGKIVKKGKPYTIGPEGYPILKHPEDQLAIIQQLSRIKRFGERIAVTKAEAIVERKLLGIEYREPEEIKHEKQEVQAVADAREQKASDDGNGDSTHAKSPATGNGAQNPAKTESSNPLSSKPSNGSTLPSTRSMSKVVQINGKRIRTAGVEAEQLEAIWEIAERHGKDKVAVILNDLGVKKSVFLSKSEADEVLAKLNAPGPTST